MKIHQKSKKRNFSILVVISLFILNILISFPAQGDVVYTIMPGDTLFNIADKFNVDPNVLIEINKLQNPSIIIPGQVLIISKALTEPVKTVNEVKPTPTSLPLASPSLSAPTNVILSSPANKLTETPLIKATSTPSPTKASKPAVSLTPAPTPTPTPKPIGPPEEMKVSVNFVNADTKMVLQALAMSMDKKIIMLPEAKQKALSFNSDNTPLLPLLDLLIKNEGATSRNLGNSILIEITK